MNPDSASSTSRSDPSSGRATWGAIAAQACDTCRARKQKCDEQRPKCRLCNRMKLECRYREPQPTKKDKSLVEILDRLKGLEGKFDRLPILPHLPGGFGPPQPSATSQTSFSVNTEKNGGSYSVASARPSVQTNPSSVEKSQSYRQSSTAYKMLTWPAIQRLVLQAFPSNIRDLKSLEQEGSAFIVRIQDGTPKLTHDEGLQDLPFVGMQSQTTRAAGGARVTFSGLTREVMHQLATAYFDTFNLLYPFLDRQNFISDTLTKVYSEGFDGDIKSVIVLLVFALGELAIEGSRGNPIEVYNGRASGVRGGTLVRPPGLALFNEARKRIGFVLTSCDLENVQIYSVAALYYESCSHHADSWRWTASASLACQVLITCKPIDQEDPRSDLIKRAYWHCVIMETGLHLELDLPLTGLIQLGDRVGIPSFNTPFCEADHRCNQSSNFKAYYASQVALQRLCADLHHTMNGSMSNSDNNTLSTSNDDSGESTAASLKHFAGQLTQWRQMLPRDLQWSEDDPVSFPFPDRVAHQSGRDFNQPLDPNLSTAQKQTNDPLFSIYLDVKPIQYPYVYDIQVALLRTRYYYAKYMVYRPLVYKALHYPEIMTQEDAQGVAECLQVPVAKPAASLAILRQELSLRRYHL